MAANERATLWDIDLVDEFISAWNKQRKLLMLLGCFHQYWHNSVIPYEYVFNLLYLCLEMFVYYFICAQFIIDYWDTVLTIIIVTVAEVLTY